MTTPGATREPPLDPGIAAITEVVRRVSRRAETITTALGLPSEEKYAVLSALGPEIAPVLAAPEEDVAPTAVDQTAIPPLSTDLLGRLYELVDELLRLHLAEHLDRLRETLAQAGLGLPAAPALGWRYAPAIDEDDLAADPMVLTQEVMELLANIASDPRIPPDELVQVLGFIRAGLLWLQTREE